VKNSTTPRVFEGGEGKRGRIRDERRVRSTAPSGDFLRLGDRRKGAHLRAAKQKLTALLDSVE
jgi:hypothetical protein